MDKLMRRRLVFLAILFIALGALAVSGTVSTAPPETGPTLQTTPTGRVATDAELQSARAQWAQSGHADTYDNSQGANTTCASCKSPMNWDPTAPAAEAAHDCSSCKREPGKPRPELTGGVPVPQETWKNITCDICHQPAGNSYLTTVSFWNQALRQYEPMSSPTALCAKCHAEQHGFQVIYEQTASSAHKGWECTRCHGPHNAPVKCTDCHNPTQGRGAAAHAQHSTVNCTTCHDAGGLPIWQDPYPDSRYYRTYMPQRFAHTLRSWPSHNLQTSADCRRCHHPQSALQMTLAGNVRCDNQACHPDGAVFSWCPIFPRDEAPKVTSP